MAKEQIPVYDLSGKKVGEQELDPSVFAVAFSDPLVHQVAVAQMNNQRTVLAHTKGRSEVRGGGKKPWKQKGTGRARHGSRRSPLWVGGGITFGPTKERNFSNKINKKMKQQALRMVLSDKAAHDKLVVIDQWALEEAKTKKLITSLNQLPSKSKKVILVTAPGDKKVITAAQNLKDVDSIGVGSLNVMDILKHEYVVIPQKLVPVVIDKYKA